MNARNPFLLLTIAALFFTSAVHAGAESEELPVGEDSFFSSALGTSKVSLPTSEIQELLGLTDAEVSISGASAQSLYQMLKTNGAAEARNVGKVFVKGQQVLCSRHEDSTEFECYMKVSPSGQVMESAIP